jgi:antitoxin component of MazEF toxin-antitoxin module
MPTTTTSAINQWGNGLAVRLPRSVVTAAQVENGTPVRITAKRGKVVIESMAVTPGLDSLLEKFDASRHGGEVMADAPVGREVW